MAGAFRLAVTDAWLAPDDLAMLASVFHGKHSWQRHDQHFYRCDIVHVEGQLSAARVRGAHADLARSLDLPLHPQMTVTAQRMHPDDGSDRHTDAPQAGYEAARLIVQLDAAQGGRFRAFDGERVWVDRAPAPNHAVAIELSTKSHHDVTPCGSLRRTLVFHAWHRANPPDARARLDAWFAGWSPAQLPRAWDPMVTEIEATRPDEVSGAAAAVAWSMRKAGSPDHDAESAYRAVARGKPLAPQAAWWQWVVRLHRDGFDREAWDVLLPADAPEGLAPMASRGREGHTGAAFT